MIYTPLTEAAMKMAYRGHHGQTDKSGIPYIFHPAHIAEEMSDEATTCVALLHDILEDTMYKKADLAEKFPPEVVEAVILLTHGKEDYYDYIRAIKSNPIATEVKSADLKHNLDESRNARSRSVTISQKGWYKEKYERALEILLDEK